MSPHSAIYTGTVMHSRSRPRRHRLSYRVFTLLLDLDELPALSLKSRLFGYNRRAILSFRDADHGEARPNGLREWVDSRLAEAGCAEPGLAIRLLCYPRIFGYAFNPLTVYFAVRPDGSIRALLYEVSNTFGERHTYVFAVDPGQTGPLRQSCAKLFYVSPFIPMDCFYDFVVEAPDDRVMIRITDRDGDGPLLVAAFAGKRHAFGDRALLRALLGHPLMTLKVTAAIHFEAIRLWWKGVPVHRHRPARDPIAHSIGNASINGAPQ